MAPGEGGGSMATFDSCGEALTPTPLAEGEGTFNFGAVEWH